MGILTENVSCTCCTEMVDSRKDGFFPKKDFLYKGWLTVKILMIEDDLGLNRGISFALAQEGYEVVTAENMEKGLKHFEMEHPDAILLDLNLPDGDGIQLCQKIRERSDLPVLMLTARDMEVDEIMGLKCGADDYMTKPFSVSVLKVRLEKILEKHGKGRKSRQQECELTSGDIRLNTKNLRVYKGEQELDLSMTELRLLQYFLENKNQVLLKEQILQHIWDEDGNYVEENTLPVNISRLRKKLGEDKIKTVHGMGYLWEESR